MLQKTLVLFFVLVATASAYVISDPVAEESKDFKELVDGASSELGVRAQRVGIVLQNVGRGLKTAVKTKDDETLTDDVSEYGFFNDIKNDFKEVIEKVKGKLKRKVAEVAGQVLQFIVEKMANGTYARKDEVSSVGDMLMTLGEEIESAGDDIFVKGLFLTGSVRPEDDLTAEESEFVDGLVDAVV